MDARTEKTFWNHARRRLMAKTLATLFLLLIGAAATGDVVIGSPLWLKIAMGVGVAASAIVAVVVMPDDGDGEGD